MTAEDRVDFLCRLHIYDHDDTVNTGNQGFLTTVLPQSERVKNYENNVQNIKKSIIDSSKVT